MAALCVSLCSSALAAPPTKSVTLTAPPAPVVIKSKPAPVVATPVKKSLPAPARVLRLPSQAGKVSQVIPTTLVAKSPSWIAKGDKHYSLCSPSRQMVACAPIAPVSLMKDIEVGARRGPKGEPVLTFKITPGVKVEPKRMRYVVAHFLARTRKQVKHFNRMEVSYAPRPGQTSVRVGATANLVDAGNGGSGGGGGITCSYDDEGSYDCVGGSYESGGGGGDGGGGGGNYDPIPATPATNDCQFNCEYPPGNDNGGGDPCLNSAGQNICQVVVITGQRPEQHEETETVGCRAINPWTIECGGRAGLPVIGGEPQQLPGRTPWFPQSWCDNFNILCSEGQEPKTEGKPPKEDIPTVDWNDPSKPPIGPNGEKWEWRGQPPQGGDKGGYVNPSNPGQSIHPDLDHPPPFGPHWDYTDRGLKDSDWRLNPDGSLVKK